MSTAGPFVLLENNTGTHDIILNDYSRLTRIIGKLRRANAITLFKKQTNVEVSDEMLQRDPQLAAQFKQFIGANNATFTPTIDQVSKTHLVFVNSTFKPFVHVTSEYMKTCNRSGTIPTIGADVRFTFPKHGNFINDTVVYFKIKDFASTSPQNKVRYAEFLGHRLAKKTTFLVNNIKMSEYTSDYYNVHWQFKVDPGKEAGYLRNIGQETPTLGYLIGNPLTDETREYRYYGNGPQTFKTVQPAVELWIPLLFWFKDVHTSFPNFMLNYGAAEVNMQLATEAELISYANYTNATGKIYTSPKITECTMYSRHLFMHEEVMNLFEKTYSYQLVRVVNQHSVKLNARQSIVKLTHVRWPVESLYVAFQPLANQQHSQNWHLNSMISVIYLQTPVTDGSTVLINNASVNICSPMVETLQLMNKDIILFPETSPSFYNSYIPYAQEGAHRTPRDIGWYSFNFNLFPNKYQPSGHFNASVDRELSVAYTSAMNPNTNDTCISMQNVAQMNVLAECINFLYVADKSAIMRFAT